MEMYGLPLFQSTTVTVTKTFPKGSMCVCLSLSLSPSLFLRVFVFVYLLRTVKTVTVIYIYIYIPSETGENKRNSKYMWHLFNGICINSILTIWNPRQRTAKKMNLNRIK